MKMMKTEIYESAGMNLIYHWVRIILGVVLVYASLDKIASPAEFGKVIYNYQLLPDQLIGIIAIILPWTEFLVGIFLIFKIWIPGTVLLTNGMFFVFTAAIISALIRGIDIDCGCFSSSAGNGGITIWTFLRDLSFMVMSLFLLVSVLFNASSPNISKRANGLRGKQ